MFQSSLENYERILNVVQKDLRNSNETMVKELSKICQWLGPTSKKKFILRIFYLERYFSNYGIVINTLSFDLINGLKKFFYVSTHVWISTIFVSAVWYKIISKEKKNKLTTVKIEASSFKIILF